MARRKIWKNKIHLIWLFITIVLAVLLIAIAVVSYCGDDKLSHPAEVSRQIVNWCHFPAAILCFVYYFILRKKAGRLPADFIWIVLGSIFLVRGISVLFSIRHFGLGMIDPQVYFVVHALCLMLLTVFLVMQTAIAVNAFWKCPDGMDYSIIHGAKTGSAVLDHRIKVARDYLVRNKETVAIASGGKGGDEYTSEAAYIAEKLEKRGVDPSRIRLEDKSSDTVENIRFSMQFITKEDPTITVVTDDYHVFRARWIARVETGKWPEAIPVHSSIVTLPHYMIREFLSTMYHFFKGDLRF